MTRIPLSLIQQRFSELIRSPNTSQANLSGVGILDQAPISIEERVAVYQNAYRIRMFESLEEDFPDVQAVLGEAGFSEIVDAYVGDFSSRHWTLARLGERLPEFIKASRWESEYPYLSDLARLEWLRVLSGLSAVAESFDFFALSRLSSDEQQRVILELSPSVQFFQSPWLVYPVEHGRAVEKRPMRLVLFQKDGEVQHLELSDEQWNLIELIAHGESIWALVASSSNVGERQITEWFSTWVTCGLIAGFKMGERS